MFYLAWAIFVAVACTLSILAALRFEKKSAEFEK
jgi:cyd operon protein YbgT